MLTGKHVRARSVRHRIVPQYLNPNDPQWRDVAERLLELFRSQQGRTRAELEDDIREVLGDQPGHLVHQGLAKLLEDRCEFEVQAGDHPPEAVRECLFRTAAAHRRRAAETGEPFDRAAVLGEVAAELGVPPELLERGMFADLKAEQRLVAFADLTAERLLHRYNEALAQAVLLRATGLEVTVRNETPQRYRQLFRAVKFHRLICEIEPAGEDAYRLRLDGPLSLFSATQRYGLQLALFLPSLLQCRDFDLRATVRWGTQRTGKVFLLSSADGLRSHVPDYGSYVPKELEMFAQQFAKTAPDWEIRTEPAVLPFADWVWVPDYQLVHRDSGACVYLEVLGFWRRLDVEKQLRRLRQDLPGQFLLAVSEQFLTDEKAGDELGAEVYRFKRQPLAEEVARRARRLVEG